MQSTAAPADVQHRWRALPLKDTSCPLLFYLADFTKLGYDILVTDLCTLWRETSYEDAIYRRARETRCSISPQEDHGQLSILLQHISNALHDANAISIRKKHGRSSIDLNGLQVSIRVPLPAPLSAFEWNLEFATQSTRDFARHVTSSLLASAHQACATVNVLRQTLHDKDHVIARLLDRLEASGTDLTSVFPGTSSLKLNRNASQRAQLEMHIKGLGPAGPLEASARALQLVPSDTLMDVIVPTTANLNLIQDLIDQEVSSRLSSNNVVRAGAAEKELIGPAHVSDDDTVEDDLDFEVATVSDSSTNIRSSASAQQSLAPSSPVKTTEAPVGPQPQRRLGHVGGRKEQVAAASSATQTQQLDRDDQTSNGAAKTKTKRLGVIKSKAVKTLPERVTNGEATSTLESTKNEQIIPAHDVRDLATATPASSQDRADARRQEIKRTLQTQPVTPKKKRRF